jgi:gamma-glutamylcyclotransferase
MPLYFAYGSNMDPEQMEQRAPGARALGPARLDEFGLSFSVYSSRWEGGAANIELDPEGHVWGVLWEIPEEAAGALDAYEGHPVFFRREQVSVTGPEGQVVAWTYRVAHQEGTYIRPTDDYLRHVRTGIRVHGLPPEALDMLDRAARPPKPRIST